MGKLNIKDRFGNSSLFIKIFISTIAIHWVILVLGYVVFYMNGQADTGFFTYFYQKFSTGGDTPHYINIAKNGYAANGEFANLIVFYPLYPFLMKILSFVVRDYFISGVIISNVCLGISGYYLYRITEKELGRKKAYDGWIIYVLYPFGMFTILAFTESLFIMLVLMALYYISEKKWIVGGIIGMLAALSRSQGIALLVPAVYEAVVYMVKNRKFAVKSIAVFLTPVGTFIYLLINKIVQGDWMSFVKHEAAEPWYNTSHWISENLTQHYSMAINNFSLSMIIYWVQLILYFAALAALFYGIKKKISTSVIAFGGAYIFLSYLHGWLISGPRYMMGCVALYIIYAAIDNKYVKHIVFILFGITSVFIALGFWQGQAIM